jgi:hypothetical protein
VTTGAVAIGAPGTDAIAGAPAAASCGNAGAVIGGGVVCFLGTVIETGTTNVDGLLAPAPGACTFAAVPV